MINLLSILFHLSSLLVFGYYKAILLVFSISHCINNIKIFLIVKLATFLMQQAESVHKLVSETYSEGKGELRQRVHTYSSLGVLRALVPFWGMMIVRST